MGSMHDIGPCPDFARLRELIDGRLAQVLPPVGGERDLVGLAVRDCLLAPGKRMRPVLVVLAARGLGHDGPGLLDVACAVEMVHAASLVLDDLPCMDNASQRRGRLTTHLRFGEDVAILAAVALLSRAYGLVAGSGVIDASLRGALVAVLAGAVGLDGLVSGQCEDLREGHRVRSEAEITRTNELKTGVLFAAALEMAALLAGADSLVRGHLRSFALELGLAFQLHDDLCDGCADTGKDPGKDLGKSTLVALLGVAAGRERLRRHLDSAESHLAAVYEQDMAIRHFVGGLYASALGQAGLAARS